MYAFMTVLLSRSLQRPNQTLCLKEKHSVPSATYLTKPPFKFVVQIFYFKVETWDRKILPVCYYTAGQE